MDAASQVSAHILTDSNREATQFVPWDRKAWSCVAFNSASYNIEADDQAWTHDDPASLATASRIVAYVCKKTGIPPTWTTAPHQRAGVCRHYDLGIAGGGHTDPTTDIQVWRRFMELVRGEYDKGGFRPSWGVGALKRIDT